MFDESKILPKVGRASHDTCNSSRYSNSLIGKMEPGSIYMIEPGLILKIEPSSMSMFELGLM
jgi:hypothetical protein